MASILFVNKLHSHSCLARAWWTLKDDVTTCDEEFCNIFLTNTWHQVLKITCSDGLVTVFTRLKRFVASFLEQEI